MKINVTDLLDLTQALKTKAGTELQSTLIYVQQALSEVTRALKKNLTLADNWRGEGKIVNARHGIPCVVNSSVKGPTGVLVLRVFTPGEAVTIAWSQLSNGDLLVICYFQADKLNAHDVSLFILG